MLKKLLFATAVIGMFASTVADEMSFPELTSAPIPNAPELSQPILLKSGDVPILTEKHGLAAPALWDWDGDGKVDLLVGEFETNSGESFPMAEEGSTVRVYRNIGTNEEPKYDPEFTWARDTEGTIMEIEQWCCIGFTPFFYDLDDDGYKDIITGQYHPGEVTWFRGSEEGFLPGVKLPQEGDPSSNKHHRSFETGEIDESIDFIETFDYWVYSSATMGDLDDDGDYDLIFGGAGLHMSENIGSRKKPSFAMRELLLDINDEPLKVVHPDQLDTAPGFEWSTSGDSKTNPTAADWDGDGVLDLLVTNSYIDSSTMAVAFFRGVKTSEGHRFEPAVELLQTSDGSKALPGSGPRVYVADWNNDGVQDLLIGASVATVNGGEFSDELSWEWERVNNVESAGKDPGLYPPREKPTLEAYREQFAGNEYWTEEKILDHFELNLEFWDDSVGRLYRENKEHWLTMRHQGRVYVMLGGAPNEEAASLSRESATKVAVVVPDQNPSPSIYPVSVSLGELEPATPGSILNVAVDVELEDGWYIYAPTGRNSKQGMIETKIAFDLPTEFAAKHDVRMPAYQYKGSFEVFFRKNVKFEQSFNVASDAQAGTYQIGGEITYQTCKDDLCLPPKTELLTASVDVVDP